MADKMKISGQLKSASGSDSSLAHENIIVTLIVSDKKK